MNHSICRKHPMIQDQEKTLFAQWSRKGRIGNFAKDGVVSERHYKASVTKLLFVAMKQTTRTAPNTSHSSLARDDTHVIAPRMPERRLHHPLKSLGRYRILPVQVVQHILEHQA